MASTFDPVLDQPSGTPTRARDAIWQARLFGAFRLVAPDGSNATPTGRKARALLAYLVLADGETVPRDRLAGLLWSERGDDQARASLRQTLYEMRALSTGETAPLQHDRTGVRVVADRLTSDCESPPVAAGAEDGETLLALIGERPADLLVDLEGIDPAFDEWLAAERLRRGGERRRRLMAAGERALLAHDPEVAQRLAMRLLARDPTDEAAARLAMRASHRSGDRDAVRQTFAQVRDALFHDLAAQPADETVALHRELMLAEMPPRTTTAASTKPAANDEPASGERASAFVDPPTVLPLPTTRPMPAMVTPPLSRRALLIGASCMVAVVAVVGSALAYRSLQAKAGSIRVLQVQPLRAATDDSAAHALRIGLSADIARLIVGNDETLHVVDATQEVHAASPDTFQVDGEARSDAGLLHATIRVAHESGGPILWSETFVRPVAEVDALREEMASKVGDVAICALGRTNPGARRFGAEALRLLFAACEQKHAYDAAETTKLFRQLLILQPDFAHGWGMLAAGEQIALLSDPADTTALGAAAERDARHALELDPHEGEAYFALALAMPGNAQWLRRMDILTRGHALDPSNGELDNHIGNDLEDVGRWHEAESFHEQAVSADPFGVFKIGDLAFVRGFGDDTAGAVKTLMIGRKRFGKHRAIAWRDFQFHALLGDARHAQAILDDAGRGFEFQPQQVALWEGVIAARIAPSTRNDFERRRAIDGAMHAPQGNVRLIVELLARDHRIDDAFAFIERLPVEARNALPTEMLFESLTASLRADPRFMTLAARHGLVDIWQATGRWPDFCSDATLTYDCQVEAKRALSPDARSLVAAR